MIDVRSLLHEKAKYSIEFNGVNYPANSVCKAALGNVTRLAFGNDEYPDYPLSFYGSATKVKHRDKYVLVTTAHQYNEHDVEWAMLETMNPKTWTSGDSFVSQTDGEGDFDLAGIDFSRHVFEGELSPYGWIGYELEESKRRIIGCIAMGYPSQLNKSYHYPSEIRTKCVSILGNISKSSMSNRYAMIPEDPVNYGKV